MNISGEEAEDLALYQEKCRRRLPESPDELHGPTRGDRGATPAPRTLVGRTERTLREHTFPQLASPQVSGEACAFRECLESSAEAARRSRRPQHH
ncbi:hypothetical protein SGLAM104S_06474 [Streptomyces glaucescens]